MKVTISIIIGVFCVIHYYEAKEVSSDCCNCSANSSGSFGYEILIGKLEDLENKLNEKYNTHKEMKLMLTKLEQAVGQNLTTIMNRSVRILQQQLGLIPFKSCAEIPSHIPGKYKIHPLGFKEPFEAYCEQKIFDGGWTVVQHRFDGSVDFSRNWTEYQNGFGSLDGEFWIGLDKLHHLTKDGNHQLLVELKDYNGSYKFARYEVFEIGSESEKYTLKKLGSYSGTAGDSLKHHISIQFSTEDNATDNVASKCAQTFKSGWWYTDCHFCNLNSFSNKIDEKIGMKWYYFKAKYEALAYSRMMIRKTSNNAETYPWLYI
ncbi:fibrinogen-like protein A [Aedes albopictus]|uniref:Fibrinogen C-terminal domain-containing protein n=1 Tax=Aedes albopictus TaxID=7160 RepID=A0ABM1YZ76_AEDAL|nr:fibrinogen-like protein A [Aedes albopictus]